MKKNTKEITVYNEDPDVLKYRDINIVVEHALAQALQTGIEEFIVVFNNIRVYVEDTKEANVVSIKKEYFKKLSKRERNRRKNS